MTVNSSADSLSFVYKNYRGEISVRRITSPRLVWKTTKYHGEGWHINAYDIDRKEYRDFFFADIIAPNDNKVTAPEWYPVDTKFKFGELVRKKSGSNWHGKIVGWYTTEYTKCGYAVESEFDPGSVQIYPEAALEHWNGEA